MWRNRNVWIILIGELIAGIGLWMGIIGNLEFMQEKVPSDFQKALILSTGLLAGVLIGPFAGKVIDRTSKKKVLIGAGIGRLMSVLFMFVAIQQDSIAWMIGFVISIQIASSFYFPALQATIPLIVDEHQLLVMNGWHMNVATIARVLGTALAGLLLIQISLSALYWMSFFAYIFLLVTTSMLIVEEAVIPKRAKGDKSGGFKEVFPILREFPQVTMTLIMTLIPLLFLGSFNLIVIQLSQIQDSTSIKGIVYAIEGISFMIGTIVIKRITLHVRTKTILFTFAWIVGLAELFLYVPTNVPLVLLAFALLGFSLGCFFPTAMLVFQQQMPRAYHGRFFAFRNMLERVMFQVVLLSSGALLDWIGLQWMAVIFALVSVSLTTFFWLQTKRKNLQFD
ncbi:MFS transporter [Savagea sp. SN6]|uniref:MFS transporter n=1 Tax=Savagea serpentis TaxID=2785297 RepID=A0A8J7G3K2_9BACL|nr:MFS transporter [Savagea serpentis]MBF4500532.1 MFS transporter [Savagea serpentis]